MAIQVTGNGSEEEIAAANAYGDKTPIENTHAAPPKGESSSDSAAGAENEDNSSSAKKSRGDKRFEKLTKEKADAEKERDMWRKAAMDKDSDAKKPEPEKSEPAKPKEPAPEDFESNDEYVKALAKFTADQAVAEARKQWEKEQKDEKTNAEKREFAKKWAEAEAEAYEIYDDLEEAVAVVDEFNTPTMQIALWDSPIGWHILYYLGTHPDKLEAISKMGAGRQIKEIGKIEARLEDKFEAAKSDDEEEDDTPVQVKETARKKPAPINPVKGNGKGRITTSIYDATDTMSQAEFEKYERARMHSRQN